MLHSRPVSRRRNHQLNCFPSSASARLEAASLKSTIVRSKRLSKSQPPLDEAQAVKTAGKYIIRPPATHLPHECWLNLLPLVTARGKISGHTSAPGCRIGGSGLCLASARDSLSLRPRVAELPSSSAHLLHESFGSFTPRLVPVLGCRRCALLQGGHW